MTGKQLKEFASRIADDSVVEVRERSYGNWEGKFSIQSRIAVDAETEKETEEAI